VIFFTASPSPTSRLRRGMGTEMGRSLFDIRENPKTFSLSF
jgi:hypothetical protein